MSYDKDCSTYWCNKCNGEMDIHYKASSEYKLVLACKKCGECRYFSACAAQFFDQLDRIDEIIAEANAQITDHSLPAPPDWPDGAEWIESPGLYGRMEWNCPHGIGHGNHIHGCDGCCQREDYPGLKEKPDGEGRLEETEGPEGDEDGVRPELRVHLREEEAERLGQGEGQ
jgi:hypothetical protein